MTTQCLSRTQRCTCAQLRRHDGVTGVRLVEQIDGVFEQRRLIVGVQTFANMPVGEGDVATDGYGTVRGVTAALR